MATPNQITSLTRTKWVEVLEPLTPRSVTEEKCAEGNGAPAPVPRPLLTHPTASRAIKANKPIKAWLSFYQGASGAANTAFGTNVFVQPNLDSSWADWQTVFDEVKVLEAECIWNTFYTVDPSAMPANSSNSICVYDPTNSVSLASVNAGLQFEKYWLCRNAIPTSSGPKVSPSVFTKDGFVHSKVRIPSGVLTSNTSTILSTGQWRPTGDASNYNWGNFALYCSVGGTTSVLRIETFVRMLCEFRTRR